jgi:hypothetical protein
MTAMVLPLAPRAAQWAAGCEPREHDIAGAHQLFCRLHGETAPGLGGGARSDDGHRLPVEERDVTRCVEQTPVRKIAENRDQ